MSGENLTKSPEMKPDGERWLDLLGYGELKGQSTGYYMVDGEPISAKDFAKLGIEGQPIPTEEFNILCDKWARPVFIGLENSDPNDPEYGAKINIVRKKFNKYFSPPDDNS
jgi:hypothetical protein